MLASSLTGSAADKSIEKEILDSRSAARIAEASLGRPDPLPHVAPSLLSADHIEDYIRKTGMVAPFHLGGGRKARLKKASYEGRIGSRAYRYDEQGNLISVPMKDGTLVVPANSIVFVESGIEFRLPDYIAIRFNLQITHVHRGLLLGTGPLVDPGFWGKLCIPLHNLTDAPYTIPLVEGLIWIEFTKTTSIPTHGRNALEELHQESGLWDIEKFIRKAAAAPSGLAEPVAIRSSIPSMVTTANHQAEAASKAGQKASESARKAADDAEKAAGDAKTANNTLRRLGIGAAVASALAVIGLLIALASLYTSYYLSVRSDIAEIRREIDGLEGTLRELGINSPTALNDRSKSLEEQIRGLQNELVRLRGEVETNTEEGAILVDPSTSPTPSEWQGGAAPSSAADAVDAR